MVAMLTLFFFPLRTISPCLELTKAQQVVRYLTKHLIYYTTPLTISLPFRFRAFYCVLLQEEHFLLIQKWLILEMLQSFHHQKLFLLIPHWYLDTFWKSNKTIMSWSSLGFSRELILTVKQHFLTQCFPTSRDRAAAETTDLFSLFLPQLWTILLLLILASSDATASRMKGYSAGSRTDASSDYSFFSTDAQSTEPLDNRRSRSNLLFLLFTLYFFMFSDESHCCIFTGRDHCELSNDVR